MCSLLSNVRLLCCTFILIYCLIRGRVIFIKLISPGAVDPQTLCDFLLFDSNSFIERILICFTKKTSSK